MNNPVVRGNGAQTVDRTAFSVVPLSQADDEAEYWAEKTPEERLEAVEMMRQVLYGYDETTEGFQRVLTITQHESR